MKNRVSQLASGIIKTPKPEIRFSVDRLDGTVAPDRVVSISVDMTSENRVPIQAFFTSTNPRVRVSKNATVVSAGKMNVEVDTTGLAVQDEIRGSIDIVFNGGEASLPYRFAVGLSGNQKQFRSLKEFSEYASSHFDEAVSIFTWKEFLMMGFMHDFRLYGLYKTYYTSLSPDSGMREFLTAAGVPLPEEEKREQLTVPEKKAFVRSRESIERITLYRMAEYFLDGTRRAHLGRSLLPVRKEIAKLMKGAKENVDLRLLYAYLLFLDHDPASAKEELYKIQDAVTKDRLSDRDRYVAFLALSAKIQEDPERIDKAAKLCHKYFREGTASFLMSYLEYKLNPDLRGDPEAAKEFLWQLYQKGTPDGI